jgi:tetratricopeptide (TPR) repeat protein
MLGVFILISRAVSLTDPKSSIGLLENNMRQDWLRYSNLGYILDQYVIWGGDPAHIYTIRSEHRERFSELLETESIENYNAKRFAEAAKGFERQLKLHPQRTFSYNHLGKCQMQAGLYDSAITLFEIAHGLDNYSISIINNLGICYATKGDIKKSEKYFHKSLSLEKDNFHALVNLTKMYISASDINKSLAYYNRLTDQNEVSSTYFYAIGQDFESHGYRQYALQAFREAIDRGVPEIVENELKSKYPELEQ